MTDNVSLEGLDLRMALVDAINEHGMSAGIEAFIDRAGIDLSQEGIIDYVKRNIRALQVRANTTAAKFFKYSDTDLQRIASAQASGYNDTSELPIGKCLTILGCFFPICGVADALFNTEGQQRVSEAGARGMSPRQKDEITRKLSTLDKKGRMNYLMSVMNRSKADLKKVQGYLGHPDKVSPAEMKQIEKALGKIEKLGGPTH